MVINPKIFEIIKEFNLNERDSILFCNLWWLNQFYPSASEILFTKVNGKDIINLDKEEDYRINFLKLDEETNELKLRYPFFVKEKNSNFELFCQKLADTRQFNSKGHINNPQDYSVYDVNQELRDAFDLLKEFDLDKGVLVILDHYSSVKPASKLSKYLRNNFLQDYKSWS